MISIRIHPIFKNYSYNIQNDEIVHIPTNKNVTQHITHSGYAICTVSDEKNHKTMLSHRLIWEWCNDIIPHGYEIDHINKIKNDNKITNLRCITMMENRKIEIIQIL